MFLNLTSTLNRVWLPWLSLRASASAAAAFLVSPAPRAEDLVGLPHGTGRYRHRVPFAAFLLSLASLDGCGGGSSASLQPPPPAPDFSIGLSANSVSVTQGATSPTLSLSVDSLNGFSGSVQVTLGALPAGVTSNPASPFTVAAGTNTPVFFGPLQTPPPEISTFQPRGPVAA